MSNPGILDGYLTRQQLAEQMGVSWRTICRYEDMADGLPSLLIGGKKIYRVESVRQWLERRERRPNPTRTRRAA